MSCQHSMPKLSQAQRQAARDLLERLRTDELAQRQIAEARAYFDAGNPGIPWEEIVARGKAADGRPSP